MSCSSHFVGAGMGLVPSTKQATAPADTSRGVEAPAPSISGDTLSPAQQLCLACALCCDGTLFDRTPLAPGESVTGASSWPQPCPKLEGTRCGAYEGRPATCRRYRCLLLEALGAGEVSLDEAVAVVASFTALPGAARTSHPDLTFHFGRRGVR